MKSKRLLLTAAAALFVGGAAMAQTDWKSYTFVELQGGVQETATNAPMDKLITPTAAVSVGHFFTPVVGARLHVNAWQSKSGFEAVDKYYKWKYVTPDLDLMLNLSNLFCQNKNHALNVMLIGGVGLNYAWDNDELKDLNLPVTYAPLAWKDNRLSHNLRAGLRLETNQAKRLGVSLEVDANSIDDRFNSKTNDADDWQFTAMLGLSYRFNHKYKKPAPEPVRVVEDVVEDNHAEVAPAPVVVQEKKEKKIVKKEVVKEEEVSLRKEVFYDIRESDNEKPNVVMKEVADFMKKYENVKVEVVGYADKGTGNAEINKKYAQKRAEQFKNDLVKRYNVDASKITTDSKGDTVQPFAENDKNRCCIITGKGVNKVKTYIEVEEEE